MEKLGMQKPSEKEIQIAARYAVPVVNGEYHAAIQQYTITPDTVKVEYWEMGMDGNETMTKEYPIDDVVLSGVPLKTVIREK